MLKHAHVHVAGQGSSDQSEDGQAHKALALDVCQGSLSSTHLLHLPQDLLGIIYAAIQDGQKRRAFFHCCKATRTAGAILAQIQSLQVDAETQDLACMCFPKSACMKSLTLGHASNTMSSKAFARLLLALQELPLFMSAEDSALLGAACARMERLVSLELDAAPVPATFFQELLQSPRARHQLHSLHIRSVTRSVQSNGTAILPFISQFHGLQALSFQLKSLPMLDASQLSSLTNLRELDVLPKSAPWNVGGLHDVLQSCTQLWKLKVPILGNSEPQTLSSPSLRVLVLESIDVEELPKLFQAFSSLQELSIKRGLTVGIASPAQAAELAAQLGHALSCPGYNVDSLKGELGVPLPDGAAPSRPGDHSFALENVPTSLGGASQDVRILAQCVAPLAGSFLMRSLRRVMIQNFSFWPGAMSDLSTVFPDVEGLEIGASNILLADSIFAEALSGFRRLREVTLGVDFFGNDVEGDFEFLKMSVINACCEAQKLSRDLVFTLALHSGMGSLHKLVLIYNKAVEIANEWYRIAVARYPLIKAHVKVLKTDYGDLF
ncbi:hypothetical protein DUNSADRAFT_3454 [Dunaliella salina]|uniref:Uncharacterized protein n=1 Tax=Dunaliella salina TaxID=3046 RepID=A0ABQ7GU43_DUNSA|nr:hypothetical protein DUNSADRAFT_3454 [Dunaliella salina]|eukprot:KAF5838084.1 hypothetical protein DUNSADRAFT_3454 [Dunaliella salina]